MIGRESHSMRKRQIHTLFGGAAAAREAATLDIVEQDFEQRIRIMLRHRWLVIICALMLITGLSVTAYYFLSRPTTFRIAVGPKGGDDTRLVEFLGPRLKTDKASIRLRLVQTDGSELSADALDSDKADLAIVRHDLAFPKNGQAVAVLRKNYAVLFAAGEAIDAAADEKGEKTKQPGIEKIEDLVGKRIGVVGRSPRNIEVLRAILNQYEIPFDKVQAFTLPTNDIAESVRAQKPDAILTLGPLSSRVTTEALNAIAAITPDRKPPVFLPIGSSEAMAERNPAFESVEIAKGTFGGSPARPNEDIETVMVPHYLVAANSASDSAIGELTRLLLALRQPLSSEAHGYAKIEKPNTEKDANAAVHPGAKAYYEDEQKTFFDRYGDHLFWLLMIVPLFGSGLAGVASYMKAGERTHHLRLLTKLLNVGKKARRAETMDALNRLQAEADELVVETVHRAERAALGESQLSFMLSIEQSRSAIADRRAILTARGPKRRK